MKRLDELAAARFDLSVQQAASLIMEGRVLVSGLMEDKPGTPVPEDAVFTLREKPRKYASRSGLKLERALTKFGVSVTGLTVCDIGASNGGFTDCLLHFGAARVFAVDVAYGILAWELRCDQRVTTLERTNARNLTAEQLGTRCGLVTADVSFISLSKIFPAIDRVLTEDGQCVCLIKPQFEAPKKEVGKNGMLKDPAILPGLFLSLAKQAAENGLYLSGLTLSPIRGTNGNIEYLALYERADRFRPEERERMCSAAGL